MSCPKDDIKGDVKSASENTKLASPEPSRRPDKKPESPLKFSREETTAFKYDKADKSDKADRGDSKFATERYSIFYSAADTQGWDTVTGTGDADYAVSLAAGLNRTHAGTACHIQNLHSEEDIYDYIDKHKQTDTPILHVLRNAPRIGSAFSKAGLLSFKKRGGKVVVTAVEFYKHQWSMEGTTRILELLECMEVADDIIFLDDLDKECAIESVRKYCPRDGSLKSKIEQACVICVPPTVSMEMPSDLKRGKDIISFGMIRTGKGLAHIRKLAGLIKQSSLPLMKDKKILVVGTVMLYPESKDKNIDGRHNLVRNEELYRLMHVLYPSKRHEILAAVQGNKSDNKILKELLKHYQALEKLGTLTPALPIELHIDVPSQELGHLFARAQYSFLPPYRGATLRNTSISCSIQQANTGLVTISHCGNITPPELSNGPYQNALVLMNDEEYGSGDDDALKYQMDGYAGQVYIEIQKRETEPKLNAETLMIAKKLYEECLSPTLVASQHQAVYDALQFKATSKVRV